MEKKKARGSGEGGLELKTRLSFVVLCLCIDDERRRGPEVYEEVAVDNNIVCV